MQVSENLEVRNAALLLLARREHSKCELVAKLSRKFANTRQIEQQVDDLEQKNLQSDERFVEAFIHSKKNRGKGPKFIKQELRQRGVSEYLIAAYVYEDDDEWLRIAEQVYRKKFGAVPVSDNGERARRIRFMVSRGFTPESAFRLLGD